MKRSDISVSAPGRICLFGEHQDYFGLPIIAAAINLRIYIQGTRRDDPLLRIDLPDIGEKEEISLEKELVYQKERDYLRSAVNVLQRKGIRPPAGWDCRIQGTIPINAGTSSSSALVIAWAKFLLEAAQNEELNDPESIAELGFLIEVAEFKEPGGMMDHYASSLGGIVNVTFDKGLKVTRLKNSLKRFVLADSLQKKDTKGTLGYIKGHVLEGVKTVQKKIEDFSLKKPLAEREIEVIDTLQAENKRLLKGTLMTRDLTIQGRRLFDAENFDHRKFGQLLTQQHIVLQKHLHTSTPKIDRMIEAALDAGALGAKINGSGGGGCMFAYAPEKTESIAEAIERCGSKVHIIQVDEGVRSEPLTQP